MSNKNLHHFYIYKEYIVSNEFKKIFSKTWFFKASSLAPGDKKFNVLPGNSQYLIITNPINPKSRRIFITGPSDKYIRITNNKSIVAAGFLFENGILNKLFQKNPDYTYNKKISANRFMKLKLYSEFIKILNNVNSINHLMTSVNRFFFNISNKIPDYTIEEKIILKLISEIKSKKGNINLNSYYNKYSMSIRQLQRLFLKFTGISPKLFCKLERFQAASDELVKAGKSIFDVMYNSGYYDQAHLSHEFRKITGLGPKVYTAKQKKIKIINT